MKKLKEELTTKGSIAFELSNGCTGILVDNGYQGTYKNQALLFEVR